MASKFGDPAWINTAEGITLSVSSYGSYSDSGFLVDDLLTFLGVGSSFRVGRWLRMNDPGRMADYRTGTKRVSQRVLLRLIYLALRKARDPAFDPAVSARDGFWEAAERSYISEKSRRYQEPPGKPPERLP